PRRGNGRRGKLSLYDGWAGLDFRNLDARRFGNNWHCRFRLQDFGSHTRQPVDAPILIFGFERRENQFREQIETANVPMAENACSTPSCWCRPRNGTSTVERASSTRAKSISTRASISQSSQRRMLPDS